MLAPKEAAGFWRGSSARSYGRLRTPTVAPRTAAGARVPASPPLARAGASAVPPAHPADSAIPPIPPAVLADLASARRTWLDHCVNSPLVDAATRSRVHLCGLTHFAPYGGAAGLDELVGLLGRLQPTVVALEQPLDLAAQAGLPYTEVLAALLELLPDGALLLSGPSDPPPPPPPPSGSRSSGSSRAAAATAATAAAEAAEAAAVAAAAPAAVRAQVGRLRALLPGLARPARVGRDMLDPYEVLGLYGSCDYVTRPGQLAEALSLFGFLPGLEMAALAGAADDEDVQVYSVDAPLRLQETWVSQLVAAFKLSEADLARRLQLDLQAAAELLTEPYLAWDRELAEALRRREAAEAAAAGAEPGVATGGKPGGGAGASPGGGARDEQGQAAATMAAFKVSRAVAAASVPYDAAAGVFALQASLQPLKWGLFSKRARHMVLQVRDLCQRMSVQRVRVDATAVGTGADGGEEGQPERVVLLVVGRQYVPYIEELWANERSALWHGDVPRTFAPSRLQRFE